MGGPRRSGFKQFTSEMVFGKTVTVHVTDRDGYGRTVADVILPDSRVLNRELGAAGLAWWYRQYSKDESLGKLEAEARATRRVLWADRDPSPPVLAEAAEGARVLKDRLTPAMQAGVADYVRRQSWQ